jgi:ATP-dependent RNA helicase DDX10/DBP4
MFERKNQNILSEHYTKLIDRGDDFAEGDDEFFTIKRADHDVSSGSELEEVDQADNLSKRKQKLSRAKRTVAKYGDKSQRLVFDDEGNAHEIYELEDVDNFYKDGLKGAMEAGRQFAQGEREKMQVADVLDKQQAKEKKKEKKRKRKEKERGTVGSFLFARNLHCQLTCTIPTD